MPIMEDSDVFAAKRKAALKDKADSLNNLLAITGTCGQWVVTRAGSLYFDEEGPKNPEIERRYQDYLLRECASTTRCRMPIMIKSIIPIAFALVGASSSFGQIPTAPPDGDGGGFAFSSDCTGINVALVAAGLNGTVTLPEDTYSPCTESIVPAFDGQTLRGDGGMVIIDASAGQPANAVIVATGRTGFTFEGIQVKGQPGGGVASNLFFCNPCSGLTIDNDHFLDSDQFAVRIQSSSDVKIIGSLLEMGDAPDTLLFLGGSDSKMSGSVIKGKTTISTTTRFNISDTVFDIEGIGLDGSGNGHVRVHNSKFLQAKISMGSSTLVVTDSEFIIRELNGQTAITGINLTLGIFTNNDFYGTDGLNQQAIVTTGPAHVVGNTFDEITDSGADAILEVASDAYVGPGNRYTNNGGSRKVNASGSNNTLWFTEGSSTSIGTESPAADLHIEDTNDTNSTFRITAVSGQIESMFTVEDSSSAVVFEVGSDGLPLVVRTATPATCSVGAYFVNDTTNQFCFCTAVNTFTCVP